MARRRPREPEPEPEHEIDLHGLRVAQALRRLEQELHACRVRGLGRVLVITGRGFGSPDQKPVLGPAVQEWLRGPDGRRLGVRGARPTSKGGALEVTLDNPGA